MGRLFQPEKTLANVLGAWPPGHFDGRMGLVHAYVDRLVESSDFGDQYDALSAEWSALLARGLEFAVCGDGKALLERIGEFREQEHAALDKAWALAEALGIMPGDGGTKRRVTLREVGRE
jgi:hypothetical protein